MGDSSGDIPGSEVNTLEAKDVLEMVLFLS